MEIQEQEQGEEIEEVGGYFNVPEGGYGDWVRSFYNTNRVEGYNFNLMTTFRRDNLLKTQALIFSDPESFILVTSEGMLIVKDNEKIKETYQECNPSFEQAEKASKK